jgi:gliding motility-associated-like protein
MKHYIILLSLLFSSLWSNSQCGGDIEFNLSIPPSADGTYPPGTTVTLCCEMDGWNDVGVNWFEGFGLNLGVGWTIVNPTIYPNDCNSFAGTTDQWLWVNTVTSSVTGNSAGPGFFFEGPAGPVDGDPGNDYGDLGTTCIWEFCVELTASNVPADDLSLSVNIYSDGDMGSWGNTGCVGADPPIEILPPGTVVECLIYGCTQPTACNYNSNADCDDGSCQTPGCTDPVACNYDIDAPCDDGSCTFGGCTDFLACNFNPQAGCDDGSCSYFSMGQITNNFVPCPDTTCTGSEVIYSVTGNQSSTYDWHITGGGLLTTDQTNDCEIIWGNTPGTYTISVQEITEAGCEGIVENCEVELVVPNIDFNFDKCSMCLNSSVNLIAQPSGGEWISEFMNGNTFIGTKSGVFYPSYLINIFGCDVKEEVEVSVKRKYDAPNIIYSAELIDLCFDSRNQTYIADDEIGVTYEWYIDDVKQTTNENVLTVEWYDTTQTYIIKVISFDEIGCESEPKLISVRTESCQRFFAPNSFTPNGDGINDIFEVRGLSIYKPILKIFNRWGVEVYVSSNLWWTGDGGNGYYCDNGVYNWIVEYKDKFGQNRKESGNVTLIR